MLILAASLAICNDRLRQETGDTPDYCLVVLLITKNNARLSFIIKKVLMRRRRREQEERRGDVAQCFVTTSDCLLHSLLR